MKPSNLSAVFIFDFINFFTVPEIEIVLCMLNTPYKLI